jgi:hypothetical protein
MCEAVAGRAKGQEAYSVKHFASSSVDTEGTKAKDRRHGDDGRAKDCQCVFHGVCVYLFLFVFCFLDEIANEGKDFKKADCQQWHRESSHQEN